MTEADIASVSDLLNHYASKAVLLWRTPDDIRDHLQSFLVAKDEQGIIACLALQDYGNGLFELRSLAVDETLQSKGLGSRLIKFAIEKCRKNAAKEVFALTRKTEFFTKNGFQVCDKANFPQKVWKDCLLCHKKDCCDELAVTYKISD
ncbi:MAG: GNAT family N-acetyltransferase [Lentisphaeria bacterium]|nr:GNAT family N-acetyltransferase [Lentisphaeria bacterium]